jgi:hypothetical protein
VEDKPLNWTEGAVRTLHNQVLGTGTKNTELDSWTGDSCMERELETRLRCTVEHNWMQTLPARPQRGHCEFLFKNLQ